MILASLSRDLAQPEYIHTLINPLPVYGLALGIIGLIIALALRSRPAQVTTLLLIFLCAASAWPAAHFGEEGYDRILSVADSTGGTWLKVHEHRADQLIWFFYLLALLALVAIFVPKKWPRSAMALTLTVLLFSFVVLGMGGYIAYAGGRILHREFRNESPPPLPPETKQD